MLQIAAAFSLTTMLSACNATTRGREPITRALPNPPSYMSPVRVTPAKKGDDLYRVALSRRQALDKANTIIVSSRKWYLGVKENYSKNPEPGFFGGMPNFIGR